MSFTVDGMTFMPDYKSKERRLYQIIASRDATIMELTALHDGQDRVANSLRRDLETVKEELRALKAKERRRATKRKKVAAE